MKPQDALFHPPVRRGAALLRPFQAVAPRARFAPRPGDARLDQRAEQATQEANALNTAAGSRLTAAV
ncbi:hypothetical protein P2318_00700 [Myxococcaceae bacterium GXIMD 01537]